MTSLAHAWDFSLNMLALSSRPRENTSTTIEPPRCSLSLRPILMKFGGDTDIPSQIPLGPDTCVAVYTFMQTLMVRASFLLCYRPPVS